MNETIYNRSHLEENDFCFSQISKAGDKCDFAQKYLFNNAANNFEDGFEQSDEEYSNYDDEERSQGTLENDLTVQSTRELVAPARCDEMFFSCCDWENSKDCSESKKRTAKQMRKEDDYQLATQFDIDSIM